MIVQQQPPVLQIIHGALQHAAGFTGLQLLPGKLSSDFRIDYDFLGVMLPVMIWVGKNKWQSLGMCGFGLLLMGMESPIQMYALLALIPLTLYNEQRGRHNLKAFFYWYYPVHLVAIYCIEFLLKKFAVL